MVDFRALARGDFNLLSVWLARPHVEAWWHHDPAPAAVEADFGPSVDGTEPTEFFVVLDGDRPIGLAQRYRIGDHPDWLAALAVVGSPADSVGIDYLIGEADCVGRGVGPEMIRQIVETIWVRYPAAPLIVVDVEQANRRSWRALEKAGFRRVWAGELDTDEPNVTGPSYLYELVRPTNAATRSPLDAAPEV